MTRRLAFALPAALSFAAVFVPARPPAAEESPVYLDEARPVDERVEDLLRRLTLDEKLLLVHADSKFTTAAIPRLHIPQRWLSDGPHGVREDIGPHDWKPAGRTDDFATALPAGVGLAATWNPDLAKLYGRTIGEEALARGKHVMLGPAINIHRTPLGGRNFEYFGEDPFLASQVVVPWIHGMQSQKVARPPQELKGFAKVFLKPGERKTVAVALGPDAFAFYDPAKKGWVAEAGEYVLRVRSSPRVGRFELPFTLKRTLEVAQ